MSALTEPEFLAAMQTLATDETTPRPEVEARRWIVASAWANKSPEWAAWARAAIAQ